MAQRTTVLSDQAAIESLDGRRHRKVSPRTTHARVQGLLFSILERCGRPLGIAGTEWDFRLGAVDGTDTLFVPDVAFVTLERLQAVSSAQRDELPIAPDVAVEVRSPGHDAEFRRRKVERYLACGTQLVLDVDPKARTMCAYAPSQAVRTYGSNDRFEHPAIPWLSFDVAEAFAGLEYLSG